MGKVLTGLEKKEDSCFPFPYCKRGVCSAPSGQQLLSLQEKLSVLRLKLFSLTLDCKPTECKQGQAGRSNLTSLSHFNDWTRLSEGCAHYCRIRWSSLVSSLFARPSKCTLLFAALWGHQGWVRNGRPLWAHGPRFAPEDFWRTSAGN